MFTKVPSVFIVLGISLLSCSQIPFDPDSPKDLTITSDGLLPKDSVVIMQWNIGHFSHGRFPTSIVTDIDYYDKVREYRQLLDIVSADIISLCEYSVLFSNTTSHPRCYADTLLFYNYPNKFIGNDGIARNYSLNALMSKRELFLPASIDYNTNLTATITHTSLIKATDYYYNKTYFEMDGQRVALINTHLAFDTNNPNVATDQISELIHSLAEEEYVVICGDFNTVASSYAMFTEAGYTLANNGSFGTFPSATNTAPLDNIISKGLQIRNPFIIKNSLSDHYPFVCTIVFSR